MLPHKGVRSGEKTVCPIHTHCQYINVALSCLVNIVFYLLDTDAERDLELRDA